MEINRKIEKTKNALRNTHDLKIIKEIVSTRIPLLLKEVNLTLGRKLWNDNFELQYFIGDLEILKTTIKTKLDKYYKIIDKDQIDELLERIKSGEKDFIILNELKNRKELIEQLIRSMSQIYLDLCNYTYVLEIIRLGVK